MDDFLLVVPFLGDFYMSCRTGHILQFVDELVL